MQGAHSDGHEAPDVGHFGRLYVPMRSHEGTGGLTYPLY